MNNGVARLLAVVALCSLFGSFASAQVLTAGQAAAGVALVGGTLLDGSGKAAVRNSVVLIRGERIEAVGTVGALPVPPGYEPVSTEGMTVLPGLWDMHTHLQYSAHTDLTAWNAKYLPQMETVIMPAIASQLLMAGITSARDLMAPLDAIVHVRDRIAKGEIPGPTLYVAGALIEHQAPAGTELFRWSATGVADMRAKVDRLAAAGVNIVKLLCVPDMTVEEATAVVERAHSHGLMVAAHGRTDDEIRKCLAAGVDDFQHLGTTALLPPDIVELVRKRVATRKLYWTPTVGSPINYPYLLKNPEMLDDPAWHRGLPEAIVADVGQSLSALPGVLAKVPTIVANDEPLYRKKFQQLVDSGVELLIGTDTGNPGHFHTFGLWVELDAWVNHMGVDANEVIRRVTSLPAAVMHVDADYGTVTAGKYADVIVVRGDPLRHIDVLREPAVVIKHGRRVK
jgi:imidazolonepropionase-like amidohydrolase